MRQYRFGMDLMSMSERYNKKSTAVTFSVTGKSRATDVNFQIKVGENFVSPGVKASTSVSSLLSQWGLTIGTQISNIKRMNSSGALESYAAGQFTTFEPGKGYIFYGLANSSFNYGKTETVTTFVYDSTGARVKKTSGSTTSIYLGKDYEVEGSSSTKHIFFGDRRITTKKSNGDIFFIHTDHINSSNVVTDGTGNQSILYEYDPYGSTVTHTGSADLRHRYTGQEADDSTKLYYYAARYYDPQIGRFITADSIVSDYKNPQEFNRYSYVNNNPIRFNDPTGHKKRSFWKKLFGIFLFGIGGEFILSHPKIARFLGQPVYRAAQAYSAGASWKETLTAAANGAGEVYGALNNPRKLPDLFKGGPRTDSFSSDTRKLIEVGLQALGLDPVSAKVATFAIEVTLTTGNRSYATITTTPEAQTSQDSRTWWQKFADGYYYGTGYGQYALEWYANQWAKTGEWYYAVGGALSALWTPETYQETGWLLVNAAGYAFGVEFKIGKNVRIAPWGNRTGHSTGELPHYHRRGIDVATGKTYDGQGIGRHRPWDSRSSDTSFGNRF